MPLSYLELGRYIEEEGINTLKLAVRNIIDVYRDRYDHIIREEIAKQFTRTSQEKLRYLTTRELNVVKKVVNESALVYKNGATREALISNGTDEEGDEQFVLDEAYPEIVDQNKLNTFMKTANKYTELCNQSLVHVCWREGKLDYDLINFDNAEIYTDPEDWKKIIAVKYYVNLELPQNEYTDGAIYDYEEETNGVALGDRYHEKDYSYMFLWTLEDQAEDGTYQSSFFRKYENVNGKPAMVSEEENPYRDESGNLVLPFVLLHRQHPVDRLLDFSTGNDLFDGNLNIALNMVHLNELIKYQSYKQIWLKVRDKSNLPESFDLDPQSVFTFEDFEGNAEIGTLDLETKVENIWQVIQSRIITILGTRGISPSAIQIKGSPQSGIALKIDKMPLLEKRQDDIEIYREKEEELFKLMRIVNNTFNTQMINVSAELRIDFGEVTFPVDPLEQRQSEQIDILNNVITPIDLIMKRNPDLERDEAEEIWNRNKGINASNTGTGIAPAQQPNTEG